MAFQIAISEQAESMLKSIGDRRIQRLLRERIDRLSEEPQQQGNPLSGELAGYYSVRAMGQRYRIVYRIDGRRIIVVVVAIGLRREGDRRDIYALARRLVRLGLVGPPE